MVHKVAGAVAATAADLRTVTSAAKTVIASLATVGVSLGPCCVPGRGPSFRLPEDEVELGMIVPINSLAGIRVTVCHVMTCLVTPRNAMIHSLKGLGIHGEPGVERIKHTNLDHLVTRVLRLMTTDGEV